MAHIHSGLYGAKQMLLLLLLFIIIIIIIISILHWTSSNIHCQ